MRTSERRATRVCPATIGALSSCSVLLISALGGIFFRNPLYVLDILIITSSISLELFLHSLGPNKHTEEMAGMLVLARLWRFMRIGHAPLATQLLLKKENYLMIGKP